MRRDPSTEAVVTFLLEVYPLIKQTRGEQREYLQRAFLAAVDGAACVTMGIQPERLPEGPRAAAEQLFRAAMLVARDQGLSTGDLVQLFNEFVDGGGLAIAAAPDASLRAAHALLAWMTARSLERAA